MQRRHFLKQVAAGLAAVSASRLRADEPEARACDVFVYGSTPGGIAAAIQAARAGVFVILACPKKFPGGMSASGLCTTDAVRRHLFGGFVHEFVDAIRAKYQNDLGENNPDYKLCR